MKEISLRLPPTPEIVALETKLVAGARPGLPGQARPDASAIDRADVRDASLAGQARAENRMQGPNKCPDTGAISRAGETSRDHALSIQPLSEES